jgi:predicted ABC-type ATPase
MPKLLIIAGPNGAGKTTSAQQLLPHVFGIFEFVNADEIARGLSPFDVESVAIQAGRLMLERMDRLLAEGADFAFETTLAAKTYVGLAKRAQALGYEVELVFVALTGADQAVNRVAKRVASGGHNIPEEAIQRRFQAGLRNFFTLYSPVIDSWGLFDNTHNALDPVARGGREKPLLIHNLEVWHQLQSLADIQL